MAGNLYTTTEWFDFANNNGPAPGKLRRHEFMFLDWRPIINEYSEPVVKRFQVLYTALEDPWFDTFKDAYQAVVAAGVEYVKKTRRQADACLTRVGNARNKQEVHERC